MSGSKRTKQDTLVRQLFDAGQAAMNAGQLLKAEHSFRASHFLQPNALTDACLGYTLLERVRGGEHGLLSAACDHLATGWAILGDPFYGLGYADALTKLGCHASAREVLTVISTSPDDGRNLNTIAAFLLAHLNAADGLPSTNDFLALVDAPVTDPYAKFYRALCRLWAGRWAEGWADYHERWSVPALRTTWRGPPVSEVPMLTAEQAQNQDWLNHHRILIWQEQGLGDVAYGIRWLPQLDHLPVLYSFTGSPNGMTIARTLRALTNQPPLHEWHGTEPMDAQCPLFSVPHLFGIPDATPLLGFAPTSNANGPICLKLTGNPQHGNDADRSCTDPTAKAHLLTLLKDNNVIDLDVQPIAERWDWERTCHTLHTCRALLTVDTAVANIAAVLHVPTVLIPQTMPEFRWGRHDTISWAPSVQIVRRTTRDDWLHALTRAVALLPH